MSIKFYRAEVIHQPSYSFAYYDDSLISFLEKRASDCLTKLDYEGQGLTEIPVVVLKQAIGEVPSDFYDEDKGEKPEYADLGLSDDTVKSIKEDVEYAEKQGNGYVTYYAF